VEARFYDGLTAQSHLADVELDGDVLRIQAAGREFVWRMKDLSVEIRA
jgi:hypothetical protein